MAGVAESSAAVALSAKKMKLNQEPCCVPTYTRLADLREKTTVNLYGVVKFFKSPFNTRGSDFCSTFRIVDPSITDMEHGLNCVLFSKVKEKLPQIQAIGNVVRFMRIGVGRFNSELQGKITPQLTWLVFDGSPGASFEPLAHSPGSYTITDLDHTKIEELRVWCTQHTELKCDTHISTIADISPGNKFLNFTCQITAKAMTADKTSVVLTVCDGTAPYCQLIQPNIVNHATRVTADEDVCCRAAGRTVDVLLHASHTKGMAEFRPGDYVLLNNVHVLASASGQSELPEPASLSDVTLTIHQGTSCGRGVHKLGINDPRFPAVQERLNHLYKNPGSIEPKEEEENAPNVNEQELEQTITSANNNLDARALQTSCTVTEHPSIPFTTLEDITSSQTIPGKFRCRVKALAYMPDSVEHFVRRCCHSCELVLSRGIDHCPTCGQEASLEYLFSLGLEDETGALHAMLFHRDALTFFPELPPPSDFLKHAQHQENVRQILMSLTQNSENRDGAEDDAEGGVDAEQPWLECCVIKYHVQKDGGTRARYRIFDTTCILE